MSTHPLFSGAFLRIAHAILRFARSTLLSYCKNLVFLWFVYRTGAIAGHHVRTQGLVGASTQAYRHLVQRTILLLRKRVPGVEKAVRSEVARTVHALQKSSVGANLGEQYYSLPATGWSADRVRQELKRHSTMGVDKVNWRDGKISGAVYHGGEALSELLVESYGRFLVSNPLHPELFPGVRKMESEVISMVAKMLNGDDQVCGNMTSGGTESLLMAIKTYRDKARIECGVTHPEMVVPETIHAAFDKAAEYFGIRLIKIPVDPATGKVDVSKAARAISNATIMLAGSAPNFPHGIVDDIPALAALAASRGIGMHVDCCLGGFIVPFAEAAGFPLSHACDFRVKGVTSVSVDTHKYGFAPKGSSVILYKTAELRKFQYFTTTDWPGGVYASPTMAGSRAGNVVAGCWATMMHFGWSGYVETTRQILTATRALQRAIVHEIPELAIVGEPKLSVVAFTCRSAAKFNIFGVAELLEHRGWHLNVLQRPNAIHIAVTYLSMTRVDELIADLKASVAALKADPSVGQGRVAAIYGTAASVPDRTILDDVCCGFLDALTLNPAPGMFDDKEKK
ncbi:hypothetical protein CXG81DRAFT_28842 [Caulochytrium protostelioides]|uniref:sphinganine-1-phosphate aldolase n=1 Tax=Caulochytrium protostelioides TaxID=1555241 RepID=A0A4P9WX99_9FUNG|nr:PLP-dependent transferase [Caulochytrium protostelioides]RKO98312.1 hypothetical protein CXG81DRAFT_28842 [Caulochytrium protostelioides]|eukprot:RKO98312.1 hypothetical protein CXG81DRAFT_28842 [Caulochytrium protostelioides]